MRRDIDAIEFEEGDSLGKATVYVYEFPDGGLSMRIDHDGDYDVVLPKDAAGRLLLALQSALGKT